MGAAGRDAAGTALTAASDGAGPKKGCLTQERAILCRRWPLESGVSPSCDPRVAASECAACLWALGQVEWGHVLLPLGTSNVQPGINAASLAAFTVCPGGVESINRVTSFRCGAYGEGGFI
jgi:hypothetical protein